MIGANLQTRPLRYLIGTTKCTKVHEKGLCGLSLCVSAGNKIQHTYPCTLNFRDFRVFRGY